MEFTKNIFKEGDIAIYRDIPVNLENPWLQGKKVRINKVHGELVLVDIPLRRNMIHANFKMHYTRLEIANDFSPICEGDEVEIWYPAYCNDAFKVKVVELIDAHCSERIETRALFRCRDDDDAIFDFLYNGKFAYASMRGDGAPIALRIVKKDEA